jgi:hypothetical protein
MRGGLQKTFDRIMLAMLQILICLFACCCIVFAISFAVEGDLSNTAMLLAFAAGFAVFAKYLLKPLAGRTSANSAKRPFIG